MSLQDTFRRLFANDRELGARIDQAPVVRWGTVDTVSPLMVFLDGDLATDLSPVSAPARSAVQGLVVGDRVLCVEQHRRVIVVQVKHTHAQVASGSFSFSSIAPGATSSVAVTFPAGMFGDPPAVVVSTNQTLVRAAYSEGSLTSAGVTFNLRNFSESSGVAGGGHWVAVGHG